MTLRYAPPGRAGSRRSTAPLGGYPPGAFPLLDVSYLFRRRPPHQIREQLLEPLDVDIRLHRPGPPAREPGIDALEQRDRYRSGKPRRVCPRGRLYDAIRIRLVVDPSPGEADAGTRGAAAGDAMRNPDAQLVGPEQLIRDVRRWQWGPPVATARSAGRIQEDVSQLCPYTCKRRNLG